MSHASRAEELARFHHTDQFRRDGVTPYITHVEAVVALLAKESDEVRAAAWLHDVLEDCPVGMSALAEIGMPHTVQRAVKLLTKPEDFPKADDEAYHLYLSGIKTDAIARKVKIADMTHNLSDRPSNRARARYIAGIEYLTK